MVKLRTTWDQMFLLASWQAGTSDPAQCCSFVSSFPAHEGNKLLVEEQESALVPPTAGKRGYLILCSVAPLQVASLHAREVALLMKK